MKHPFLVGEKVIDNLTKEEHIVIGISFSHGYVKGNSNKICNNCHYWGVWIDSTYLDGARHPSELTKIQKEEKNMENQKLLTEEKGENEMQIETKLTKAVLTHQLDGDNIELVIRPHPAIFGTAVLTIQDGPKLLRSITVNISELREVVGML